ncbi:adenylate/guanylate cyclase domain-containing protein [Marinihelvus fidelis]|uniref:Adenylate/guanylate cyclase domain-containing protein n=1 Tax=Marinihelvus fidelis TaxID=2613842 RepID=A0A5N0TG45_9GAMM|nr:adenylate/guanylate cyclase domain-containing protein [Marinihelvus fidelis]KAA9134133.1 adenylate/guanylate cyclase domain-containing protein [Marinihelvus fidelis]
MFEPVRYVANRDGQYVAYQVMGSGELDIIFIPDWVTNLEVMAEEPSIARFFETLSSFGRLILFDKRGSGLSDPVPLGAIPTPEEWMQDIVTVMNDLDSDAAAIIGHAEGGSMATLFAATRPNRCRALVLVDTCARRLRAPGYPEGMPEEVAQRKFIDHGIRTWCTGESARDLAPDLAISRSFIQRRARLERLAMSPAQFAAMYPTTYEMDTRHVLGTLKMPTLVLHRSDNPYMRVDGGRYLADNIPGATMVEIPGNEHLFHAGDTVAMLDAVGQFLAGTTEAQRHDRVLSTVMFTDIAGSTELAARMGDQAWSELLAKHHAVVRAQLQRFRGKEVDNAGDGFFATFDGPARGARCALSIRDEVRALGLDIRAGLHTGEVERHGKRKVTGIAVHIGARVAALAEPGQVLVSRTVSDLVAGSGLKFSPLGDFALKGVDGEWSLFEVL